MSDGLLLFVYGSLRRDRDGRHHDLLREATFVTAATVRGRLYRVSWHPGVVLDPAAGPVRGEVFHLPPARSAAMLAALDAYEGVTFSLTPATATGDRGETLAVSTYAWLGNPAHAEWMPGGDWGTRDGGTPNAGPTTCSAPVPAGCPAEPGAHRSRP